MMSLDWLLAALAAQLGTHLPQQDCDPIAAKLLELMERDLH